MLLFPMEGGLVALPDQFSGSGWRCRSTGRAGPRGELQILEGGRRVGDDQQADSERFMSVAVVVRTTT
jgi:hypothetical protein